MTLLSPMSKRQHLDISFFNKPFQSTFNIRTMALLRKKQNDTLLNYLKRPFSFVFFLKGRFHYLIKLTIYVYVKAADGACIHFII